MIIKINLEKAFDQMEWRFIKVILEHFHFPPPLIKIIMACISNSSISILLNGGMLEPFRPYRGWRLGDPLSPYIFILCMEFLGLLINESCQDGDWKPLKSSRSRRSFSHLFFVDDLVLFSKATTSTARAIEEVLEKFCYFSSQKVSFAKSKEVFSHNVDPSICGDICHLLNIRKSLEIGKYLGTPIKSSLSKLMTLSIWLNFFFFGKLAGWKSKLLSLASRATLIQSISKAIPSYVMQCVSIPAFLCDRIDAKNRDFLWGSTPEKRKIHAVSWRKVTRPKATGWFSLHSM